MPPPPAHILIADDDASVRRLIELVLRKDGYRLTMAANGWQALELLQTETPDLLISDLNMPDLDGFQLLTALKATPGLARLPVIVVTAAGQPGQEAEALRLGAAACVLKPFAQAQFLALVRGLLAAPR
ncbi:MAG: response regulator [Anaerolineales bacterium]|nr:response regulator [Anaerolineales bacterium]